MINFGTGGWRAIIGEEFTKANVQLLTLAIARIMKAEGSDKQGFCIGYDRRFLSDVAARWAAEVMAEEGIPCKLLKKEAPTPLIMFTIQQQGMQYGMAITASHNPALYNGIKVFTAGGRDADETVTARIEQAIVGAAGCPVPSMDYEKAVASGLVEEIDPFNDYIDSILHTIDLDAIKQCRLKVALDPMYGVSQTSLQTILMTARCDVGVIHERHDTLFGGRLPAPNESTMRSLIHYVLERGCDLGIATDGDADRIGVIDDTGEFLHPNRILTLLYYYLLKYKGWRGPAVRNNSTTHLLDKVAESFGEKCYEVPVGFKHVSAKMRETDAIIGGESSGGLTVRGHIEGKDGIYAAALLVEMVAVTGKPLSALYREIVALYGKLYTKEADFRMKPERKQELMKLLFEEKQLPGFSLPIEQVSYQDGCKVTFQNGGWIIARFSGTEPLLRLCCEMPERETAEETVACFRALLKL